MNTATTHRTPTTSTAAGIHAGRQLVDVSPLAVDGRTELARDAPSQAGAA